MLKNFERKTRLELATPTLARLCSTNWAISANFFKFAGRLEAPRYNQCLLLRSAFTNVPHFSEIRFFQLRLGINQTSLFLRSACMKIPQIFFRNHVWVEMDSNHRRRKPADLQSAPFGHSGIYPVHWRYVKRGDSCRIQTCNLLIRSQMLYSVELRSRPSQIFKLSVGVDGFEPPTLCL